MTSAFYQVRNVIKFQSAALYNISGGFMFIFATCCQEILRTKNQNNHVIIGVV